jgi:ubiquinone/menaquinone biosynthesis C-methylase UbiE
MKIRESGMPEREMWEKFFNPAKILTTLGLNSQTGDVAEFGCGYGTFTIPAAKIIKGKIYALDIEPDMIRITNEETKKHGLNNVRAVMRDFMAEGSGLTDGSIDYIMLFNILHLEKPMRLINEAKRILKDGGKLGIIHWNYDPSTPRGPSMDIRPKPEDCIKWAEGAGFSGATRYDLKPYHYGIVLTKKSCGNMSR